MSRPSFFQSIEKGPLPEGRVLKVAVSPKHLTWSKSGVVAALVFTVKAAQLVTLLQEPGTGARARVMLVVGVKVPWEGVGEERVVAGGKLSATIAVVAWSGP